MSDQTRFWFCVDVGKIDGTRSFGAKGCEMPFDSRGIMLFTKLESNLV